MAFYETNLRKVTRRIDGSISWKLHSIFQLEMQNIAKRFLGYWEL